MRIIVIRRIYKNCRFEFSGFRFMVFDEQGAG